MDNLFFTNEHKMIKEMVREFAESEVKPVARQLDKNSEFPKNLVKRMGELGLMGIHVPDKYGGATAIFIGFIFYLAGLLMFYSGLNTGHLFTLTLNFIYST